MKIFKTSLLLAILVSSSAIYATEPDGYYTSCENKSGADLLKALNNKVSSHTTISYDGLWELYKTSDVKPNGKIWDMYSTKEWPVGSQHCGNYKLVGDCYNREHSFPKSWFNDAKPMYSDAFHLYPTDGKVNGQRSNYPYGECEGGTTLPSNGSVDALGRLGKSTFPGYSGTVFEPVNDYKGDFARSYFYMAAAYNDKIGGWHSDMLAGNSYPAFSSWAVNLLLKWHRQDPVSNKEINRNEAVYAKQRNRNPFIDHPELAEHIWGNKKTVAWSLNMTADPELISPADGSTISLGTVAVDHPRSVSVSIKGLNLTEDVNISVSGAGYSIDRSSVTASDANAEAGTPVNITLTATSTGTHNGTLTLSCGDLSTRVSITANALDGLPASAPTNISDRSFVAHWTYIGDEDSNGCYTLTVKDSNGQDVDTYPRSVPAKNESYLVDELDASTTYTYSIASRDLTSNTITVTTMAPIPMIQFMYDGDLHISAEPGTPSDAYELLVDIENIDTDIAVSVKEPFEISTDKGTWATATTLSPIEDRIYIRVNSATEGVFESSITARAGEYVSDDATVSATVSTSPDFIETFEPKGSGNYNETAYAGSAANWTLGNAGVFQIAAEAYDRDGYLRLGKNNNSYIELAENRPNGIGIVEFMATSWRGDGAASIDIQYSTDNGSTWNTAGTVTLPSETSGPSTDVYKKYTVTVNKAGNVRLKFSQTSGKRACIDNIAMKPFSAGIDGVVSDYRSWDAYCQGHALYVELNKQSHVAVYGVDGITYANTEMPAGTSILDLPQGLYIVVVEDFSRRVLVK